MFARSRNCEELLISWDVRIKGCQPDSLMEWMTYTEEVEQSCKWDNADVNLASNSGFLSFSPVDVSVGDMFEVLCSRFH